MVKKIDWKRGLLGILIIVVLVFALYSTFQSESCDTFDCFQEYMNKCKAASFVNEEFEASWEYSIKGEREGNCEIEVTLLNAKEGDLGLRDFEGNSMVCWYETGTSAYPEEDLSVCSGLLKENLQGVIIDKLFQHIVENIGEINEELRSV